METKKLPAGIDNFSKLREQDFYYVDKTGLIKELLTNWGEVNLFTRPCRRHTANIDPQTASYFQTLLRYAPA